MRVKGIRFEQVLLALMLLAALCWNLANASEIKHLRVDTGATGTRAEVLLEAPHRIEALAQGLTLLEERPVTLARELSKQFETITTLPARQLAGWLAELPERSKGEFVVIVHAAAPQPEADTGLDAESERVLRLLLAELPTKGAVKLAAEITGAARNTLYERALALKAGH